MVSRFSVKGKFFLRPAREGPDSATRALSACLILAALWSLGHLATREDPGPGGLAARPGIERARVDIGAASLDELVLLPGIGPARAGDILALRSALGGFTSPDDLLGVPGIGPATFLRLEPWITLETRDDPR